MAKTTLQIWVTQEHEGVFRQVFIPEYKKKHPDVEIMIVYTGWRFLWDKIAVFTKKQQGPDVLQIGNTWNGALAEMGALKDITDYINKSGTLNVFTPAATRLCEFPGANRVSSVPWYVDVRALFYRKDVFDKFALATKDIDTLYNFERTCQKINEVDIGGRKIGAFGISGQVDPAIVHSVAPWLWNSGGDFLTVDGKQAYFNNLVSLKGIELYFNIVNKYAPWPTVTQNYDVFLENFASKGDYSIIYSGPWINNSYLNPQNPAHSKIGDYIFPSLMPAGPAGRYTFLGGSNLAISNFSRNPDEAWEFIKFLFTREMQDMFCTASMQLPALLECYNPTFLMDTSRNKIFKESVRYGRTLPNNPHWGPIEAVLIEHLHNILWSIRQRSFTVEFLHKELNAAAMKVNNILQTKKR